MEDLGTDLKLTGRALARTPARTGILVLTLALGIGATTAIFSVLNGVLFAPLPYPEPDELFALRHDAADVQGVGLLGPGGADLVDYQEESPSIEGLAGVQTLESNLNDDQGAARVTMAWTTPDYFQVLGIDAAVGRVLQPSDWAGADRSRMEDPTFTPPPMAVLLGHGLWTARFGADPGVLGQTIRLNGQSMEVVGVLPADFRIHLPRDAEVPPRVDAMALMPVPMGDMGRGSSGLDVVVRTAEGVSPEQARREVEAVARSFRERHPVHAQLGTRAVLTPLHQEVVGDAQALLWILFGAVGLLLLIASVNVANLQVVRAAGREREFAVRAALGVAPGRIVRQLLTESVVLTAMGALVGLAMASWAVELLASVRPADLPRVDGVALDGTVLAFTVLVSLVVALAFGMIPALSSARPDARSLVSGRGTGGGSRAGVRLRRALVITELAVSVVLVAGAGLLLRSFGALSEVELGLEPEGVVAVDAALPFFSYREDAKRAAFFVELGRRAAEIPGVESAGVTAALPLEPGGGGTWSAPYATDGTALDAPGLPRVRFRAVTPGALTTLGLTLREGRDLSLVDEEPGGLVPVVVDARVADLHWPEGALDRTFRMTVAGYTGQPREAEARIVGVSLPARFGRVDRPDEPTVFLPYREYATVDGSVVLRTDRDPAAVAADVRALVAELDGGIPVFGVRRLDRVVAQATAETRYALWLLAFFAGTALLMAAVGLYGVVATLVQQRTREIGVRIALGALASDIRRMVARDGVALVLPGLVLGMAGAALLGPAVGSLLYEVDPLDPLTLLGTGLILGAVAWGASVLPARRAARLDPIEALNEE